MIDQEITAGEILVIDLLHILLRRREGRFCDHLTEQRRTQPRLAEFHHRLAHRFVLGDQRTDTNAALRITLRHAVHQHHILLYALQMASRDIRRFGIDELAIDLIGDQVQVVFLHQIADLAHLLLGIEIARRVIGVADQDCARLRRNLLLKLLHRRQLEPVLDIRLDGFDDSTCRDRKCHIVGVRRVGHNDLVARIEARHVRKHDRLRTAGGNNDLVRRKVDPVLRVVTDHLRPQRLQALRRGILQDLLVKILHRLHGLRRGLDIRLTDVQVIHMHPCQLGCIGVLC